MFDSTQALASGRSSLTWTTILSHYLVTSNSLVNRTGPR